MRILIEEMKKTLRHTKFFHIAKNNMLLNKINKYYQSKHAKDKSKRLQEHGMQAIKLMKEAFLCTNYEFWLDYGTLLGAIREKDFIGHDFDVDFGALYKNNEQAAALERELLQKGFSKYREFLLSGRIVEQTYVYNGVHIDVFYYEKTTNGKVSCYSLEADTETEYKYFDTYDEINRLIVKKITSTFIGVKMIDFKGELFPVPQDDHAYLVDNYGETYMIKNANWDWTTSVSNFEVSPASDETKAFIYKHT